MNRTNALSNRVLRIIIAAEYALMVCLIAGTCYFADIKASAFGGPCRGVIVIDPGHGGVDGGTVGEYGLLEKDVNLRLSLMLKELLEEEGYAVVMTRDTDTALDSLNQSSSSRHMRDLIARAGIINRSGAMLFLSIHVNSMASNPRESGSIVFYGSRFKQSRILAYYIQNELNSIKAAGRDRVHNTPLRGRKYYILNTARVPGVIVETAFITNPEERALLATDDFVGQLAAAIAGGTDAFLKSEQRAESYSAN